MARARDLQTAQHEAAHVVVGVALGLRLREAAIGEGSGHGAPGWLGYTLFDVPRSARMAWVLTLAAGVAWDRAVGDVPAPDGDTRLLRRLGYRGRAVGALVAASGAMLAGLGAAHARVTRALLERDLTGADIAAIARGERPDDD
jgi:hypothetical protein